MLTMRKDVKLIHKYLAVAAALSAGLPAVTLAQTPAAPGRIAWINLQQILPEAPGYAAAESTLTKEMQGFQKEVEKLKLQFDSTVNDYQKQAAVLSPAAKQAKEIQLRDLTTQMQQRTTELQNKAQRREQELVQPIVARVRAAVERVRAERNIAIVFDAAAPGSGIVAADRTLDLTSTVVQRLKSAAR
jgi:outer membrane protein